MYVGKIKSYQNIQSERDFCFQPRWSNKDIFTLLLEQTKQNSKTNKIYETMISQTLAIRQQRRVRQDTNEVSPMSILLTVLKKL